MFAPEVCALPSLLHLVAPLIRLVHATLRQPCIAPKRMYVYADFKLREQVSWMCGEILVILIEHVLMESVQPKYHRPVVDCLENKS